MNYPKIVFTLNTPYFFIAFTLFTKIICQIDTLSCNFITSQINQTKFFIKHITHKKKKKDLTFTFSYNYTYI